MPVCFQLTRKGEKEPIVLQRLDEEICKHLGMPVDDVKYVLDWYDIIGFRLALGWSFDKIAEYLQEQVDDYDKQGELAAAGRYKQRLEICRYLDQNFTTDSWREVGRAKS